MKKKSLIPVLMVFLFCFFVFSSNTIFSQAKSKARPGVLLIAKPMKVIGYITLIDDDGNTWYNNRLFLYNSANNPVRRIPCTFDNKMMTENLPGLYAIEIKPATPTRGVLNIDINNPRRRGARGAFIPVKAKYRIGDLIRITGPAPGAHIPMATTPRISLSWTGGTPGHGFIVQIYEMKGKNRGVLVFDRRNVTLHRLTISSRIFRVGVRYQLNVLSTLGRFALSGRTITGSEIQFQQVKLSYFYMD